MKARKIGFIGVGKMGKGMASNILKAGLQLTVYDLASELIEELVKLGAVRASSPKEVGQNSEIVIFMVPDSPNIDAAISGENGVLGGMRPGNIIIVTSTVEPLYIQRLSEICAKRGIKVIDCPVSGSVVNAREGTLIFMAGGPREVLEECRDVLGVMSKKIVHCGDALGSGEMVKVANNLISITTALFIHEAMVLGAKFGLKADKMFEVFKISSADNWILNNQWPRVLKGDFGSTFDLDLGIKDLGLALATAKALKVPLFLGAMSFQWYLMESAAGKGKLDMLSAITSLEKLAGVEVRSESK